MALQFGASCGRVRCIVTLLPVSPLWHPCFYIKQSQLCGRIHIVFGGDQPNQNAALIWLLLAIHFPPVVAPCLGVIAILIVFAVQREASAPGWFRADFSTRTHHTTSLLTSTTNLVRQHLPHAGVQLMLPAVLCAHACVFATTQKCVLDGGARTPLQTLRDNKHYGHSQGGK